MIVQTFDEQRSFCVFKPQLKSLVATYTVHLRFIGNIVVLSEHFARYYGWVATSEWVISFLTEQKHMLSYLVPYYVVVDLHEKWGLSRA